MWQTTKACATSYAHTLGISSIYTNLPTNIGAELEGDTSDKIRLLLIFKKKDVIHKARMVSYAERSCLQSLIPSIYGSFRFIKDPKIMALPETLLCFTIACSSACNRYVVRIRNSAAC